MGEAVSIDVDHLLLIVSGILVPLLAGVWALWTNHGKKIDKLSEENGKEHDAIHGKIDRVRDKMYILFSFKKQKDYH